AGAVPTPGMDINVLAVNAVHTCPDVALAPGNYKAFISPGDMPPQTFNDSFTFSIGGACSDLKVLPVAVLAGAVHVNVENVGTGAAAAGKDLMVQKVGSPAVNKGPIGALLPGTTKLFTFPLPPGNYKAFINPGDMPPH